MNGLITSGLYVEYMSYSNILVSLSSIDGMNLEKNFK